MFVNRVVKLLTVFVALAVTGCAGYSSSISRDERPTPADAYFYGRFSMDAPKAVLAMGGYQTMGFAIDCVSGEKHVLRFDRDNPVQVIKIRPSTCSLMQLVYTNADGFVKQRKPAPAGMMKDVVFAPGKAYYLGDFAAKSTTEVIGNMIYWNWNITDVKNNYDKTSEEMKTAFPNMTGFATEDRMIGKK